MTYIYSTGPIDYWDGWMTQGEFWVSLTKNYGEYAREQIINYCNFLDHAMETARRHLFWEGDVRQGEIYISGIPPRSGDPSCEYMVAWKQDNNGTCFIATPYRLPWLESEYDLKPATF